MIYLHIPKTAGTAIKNFVVDNPGFPLQPAHSHDVTLFNTQQATAFSIRDPLEKFCSGYWERFTNPYRRKLNDIANPKYRRSGYQDLSEWEQLFFNTYKTPNAVITALRTEDIWEQIQQHGGAITELFGSYTRWLGDLETYKQHEHKVCIVYNLKKLDDIFLRLYGVELPKQPFLRRSRQQFQIPQSYDVDETNTEWFKSQFRKADYELLDHIKQQEYYIAE